MNHSKHFIWQKWFRNWTFNQFSFHSLFFLSGWKMVTIKCRQKEKWNPPPTLPCSSDMCRSSSSFLWFRILFIPLMLNRRILSHTQKKKIDFSHSVIFPNEVAITLVYKNINCFYLRKVDMLCVRESDRKPLQFTPNLQVYTTLRYIFREPCFFMLLLWETNTQFLTWGIPGPFQANPQASWLVYSVDCSPQLTVEVENFFHYIFFLMPTHFFPCNTWGFSTDPCLS